MMRSIVKMFGRRRALLAMVLGAVAPLSAQSADQGTPLAMGAGRGVQGTVTAAAGDHLTVKTERGEVYQIAVTPNTRVMKGRDPVKLSDVHAGDGVGAMGELDPATKTVHALFVMVVDAEQIKKAREALGKTFISGTVTAIDETKLTVMRSDQVTQVIQVDEDTSFRRGGRAMQAALGGGLGAGMGAAPRGGAATADASAGESLTLADVKVGSLVAGPGVLKNGVFVPTQLGVGEANAQRQRRRQQDGAGAGGTTPPGEPK